MALYLVRLLSLYLDIISLPTLISPLVTLSIPPSKFNSVDFPAPLGPKITTNSPLLIVKLTPSKALNLFSPTLYVFFTFLNLINSSILIPF